MQLTLNTGRNQKEKRLYRILHPRRKTGSRRIGTRRKDPSRELFAQTALQGGNNINRQECRRVWRISEHQATGTIDERAGRSSRFI